MVATPGVLEVDGTDLRVDQSGTPFPGTIERREGGLTLRVG
jgi:hypothetical protein